MKVSRLIVLTAVIVALSHFVFERDLFAQEYETEVFHPVDIVLHASESYGDPIEDVEVVAEFAGPSGQSFQVNAFWNGDQEYRIRFAPNEIGSWSFCTVATEEDDTGLHAVCGELDANPYWGENEFGQRGWPIVSENQRYLTYDDGTPFFLVVEAAMEISWKSTITEVETYIADRRDKGINAVWIVPMSHQYFRWFGVNNRLGHSYFTGADISEADFTNLNPRYFDYLDLIVQRLNEAGMIVLMNPIWGRMAEVYENSVHERAISLENALVHARYIGARYAGHNVMWLVAGDALYEEREDRAYWNQVAEELDRASGGNHLMTAHATGFHGSHDYFADATWLDFHAYTPSHWVDASYNWQGAIDARNTEPVRPVLNIEYNFEDLYDRFWLYFDDPTGAIRISSADVRMGAYQGILSGALAGTSYGANGIWQWATPSTLNGFGVRYTATEALELEGSTHIKILSDLMELLQWYNFTQFDGVVKSFSSSQQVVAARSSDRLMAYLPRQTLDATFNIADLDSSLVLNWIDPTTGSVVMNDYVRQTDGPSTLTVIPPGPSDWVLTISNKSEIDGETENPLAGVALNVEVFPNPSSSTLQVRIHAQEAGAAVLTIYDMLGRRARRIVARSRESFIRIDVENLSSGVYLYEIEFSGLSGIRTHTGKIVRSN